ncbi:MAG: right-handed parallel beta-helix repeat-containing protein [Rubellimicrobium sp.]|nr:right-handed parallel beta-helix repeat-containing protein [Rubellimicrobium sp.]
MNKAITEGLALMPVPFSAGLGHWSSGDGTPGSDSYAGAGGGTFIPADQDFGPCLEITKTASVQKLRYTGETPILPGLYLRVTARVKAVSGPLPAVRIAGWAGVDATTPLQGVVTEGAAVTLPGYGDVVEVSAIIGTGLRGGVDMVWSGAQIGHLGLDFTGANGGVLRVGDITIEDITHVFLRDMLAQVDVRDFGARGDGITDDTAAFIAADAAADGRMILVPAGTYRLAGNVTLRHRARFEGKVVQDASAWFILQKNFDFPSYADAFADEETAFRKAFQALLNFSDHDGLDLCGRRVGLSGPVDMQGCDPGKTSFATRRVIRNGQFQALDSPLWDDGVTTSQATYAAANPRELTAVANIANIEPGSLVTGAGTGREVYVTGVNIAQGKLTLSRELYDAEGTQVFTFRRFRYLLDFSGFDSLSGFTFADIDLFCEGRASGVMLARQGIAASFRDCAFTRPKDRAITSTSTGCQGLQVDRCQFISNEQALPVGQRSAIAFNANANDVKIRDNRVVMWKHFCVLGGSGNVIAGNHWFHGDTTPAGVRQGGIILTSPNVKTMVTGNYIDNNFIEWTNEHDATPALGQQYSFGGLTITGNIFTVNDVAPWFRWLVIKPHGPGHFIHGLTVMGNVFRALNGSIERIEQVDTTIADLDFGRMRNVTFAGNVFHGVAQEARNPASLVHVQSAAADAWIIDTAPALPFLGRARTVEALVAQGALRGASGQALFEHPHVETEYGAGGRQVRAVFATACTGSLRLQVRMDNPL